jgi:hydroxypyruvate isomerase
VAHSLRYLANCSIMFTELPLVQRPAAARSAGFEAVEFWWPFDRPVPGDAAVDEFVAAVADAGVALVALNFFAGDLTGPDRGVLSIPDRSRQFTDNIEVTVGIGERLGARGFNALYGNRVAGLPPGEQDELAAANIAAAAAAAARIGATVLVEPLSGPGPYPLRLAADAAAVVERARAAGAENVGILFDLYHLAVNGDDIDRAIAAHAARIAHVQIADVPGRGEPGSGRLDLDGYLSRLERAGYDGWVALEYQPTVSTLDSLSWLPRARRTRQPAPRPPHAQPAPPTPGQQPSRGFDRR